MKRIVTNVMILVFGFLMLGTVNSYTQEIVSLLEWEIRQMREAGMDDKEIFGELKTGGATETELRFVSVRLRILEVAKEIITEENVNIKNEKGKTLLFVAIEERKEIKESYKKFLSSERNRKAIDKFGKENPGSKYTSNGDAAALLYLSKLENSALLENMEIIKHLIDMGAHFDNDYDEYWLEELDDYEEIKKYIVAKEESLESSK